MSQTSSQNLTPSNTDSQPQVSLITNTPLPRQSRSILSAAIAPHSSSLKSDDLCLHNPIASLFLHSLFVSLEQSKIFARRHSPSQHAPVMKILIAKSFISRSHPLQHLANSTPRCIQAPLLNVSLFTRKRTPLTSSILRH